MKLLARKVIRAVQHQNIEVEWSKFEIKLPANQVNARPG